MIAIASVTSLEVNLQCNEKFDGTAAGGISFSALVPFADLMNHAHNPSISWKWDSGSGESCIVAAAELEDAE